MFSTGHLIWIAISAVLIVGGFTACMKIRPELNHLLSVCLVVGILSEFVKILSVAGIYPVVEPVVAKAGGDPVLSYVATGQYSPYIKLEHLPLELCSLQIVFIAAALWCGSRKWKRRFLSLIFVAGVIGGGLGILLASVAGECETLRDFFIQPRIWQFFLYHSMVVTLGLYVGLCRNSEVSVKCLKEVLFAIASMDVLSFYLNSVFAQPVYTGQEPAGLVYTSNFFSSYNNPLGIVMTQKWQWMLYLFIRFVIAVAMILLLFLIQSVVVGSYKTPPDRNDRKTD